jgi:hypothetical protein
MHDEFETATRTVKHPRVAVLARCEAYRAASTRALASYRARSWESLGEAAAAAAVGEFEGATPTLPRGWSGMGVAS